MIDLNRIDPRHKAVNVTLEDWARWVRVSPGRWPTSPMFRQFQSRARQWDADPHIHIALDGPKCLQTEKCVSTLPEAVRTALRWCYVFPWVPVSVVRRALGLSREDLLHMLDVGRDMVQHNLKRDGQ